MPLTSYSFIPSLRKFNMPQREALPHFKYHPDPIKSDVVVASDRVCLCCQRARGYMYEGPTFTTRRDIRDNICPWCIADGSAAAKFNAKFAGVYPLFQAGVARTIVDEVSMRTPGYVCWQENHWQSHCGDACAFHGDATIEDVANASRATIDAWKTESNMKDEDWARLTDGYEPKGHVAFYKFVCRHCEMVLFSWDLD